MPFSAPGMAHGTVIKIETDLDKIGLRCVSPLLLLFTTIYISC